MSYMRAAPPSDHDVQTEPQQTEVLSLKQAKAYWEQNVGLEGNRQSAILFEHGPFQAVYRSLVDMALPHAASQPYSLWPEGPNLLVSWQNSGTGPRFKKGSGRLNKNPKLVSVIS